MLVVVALALPRPRTAAPFAGGVAAGFLVPVVPFVILSPQRFYQSVFIAQLVRYRQVRVPVWSRLQQMTGLNYLVNPGHLTVALVTLAVVGFVAVALAGAWMITRRPPPPLDWFAVATAALIVIAFMWPPGFFFHFPAFLAPFLALAIALPASRLLDAVRPSGQARWLPWAAAGLAGVVIVVFAVIQVRSESALTPRVRPEGHRRGPADDPARGVRADRPGVLHDRRQPVRLQRARLLADDRPPGHRLRPQPRARRGCRARARSRPWRRSCGTHSTTPSTSGWPAGTTCRRIAWTPALGAYFHRNFVRVLYDTRATRCGCARERHDNRAARVPLGRPVWPAPAPGPAIFVRPGHAGLLPSRYGIPLT